MHFGRYMLDVQLFALVLKCKQNALSAKCKRSNSSKVQSKCIENARQKPRKPLSILESARNAQSALILITMYRYQLDKSSKKFRCPNCHKKRFVRYKDFETGGYLPIEYGRCDREVNCGYFKQYIPNKNDISIERSYPEIYKLPNYHPYPLVQKGLETTDKNQFVKFMNERLGKKATNGIIQAYKIGNAPFWYDATIYWQIDQAGNVHGGKMMAYGADGKRTGYTNWIHSWLIKQKEIDDFNLEQCLFGLHLAKESDKPIAIVESEKTACVMSHYYPKYLWMATGSLNGLNRKKLIPIKNRKIILYPDTGIAPKGKTPFEQWEIICLELRVEGFDIEISCLLEQNATVEQKRKGYDLADFFLA